MKAQIILLLVLILSIGLLSGQNIAQIGYGTVATDASNASPINIYYESLHCQMVYTVAELNAAGVYGPKDITGFGFYIASAPSLALPNYVIRMKHTSAEDVTSHIEGPYQTVYSDVSYMPTAGGYDRLNLTSPFAWNGVENILVDVAFAPVSAFSSSGTVHYTSQSNGFRFIRADDVDQTDIATTVASNTKPICQISFAEPAMIPPDAPILISPSNGEIGVGYYPTLEWAAASGNTSGYRLSLGTDPGATNILNNEDVGNANTYNVTTGLSPNTTYYWKVEAWNVWGNSTDYAPYSFTTMTDIVTGSLDVFPYECNFGDVNIGEYVSQVFSLTNTGGDFVTVSSINIDTSGDFALADLLPLPFLISPSSMMQFIVNFHPTFEGYQSTMMSVSASSTPGEYYIPISGNGVAAVSITFPWGETFDSIPTDWDLPYGGWNLTSTDEGGTAIYTMEGHNLMITPELPISTDMAVSVKWFHTFGTNPFTMQVNYDTLKVAYSIDGTNWTPIWEIKNQNYDNNIYSPTTGFATSRFRIPSSAVGNNIQLAFEVLNSAYGVFTAIDSVGVYDYVPTASGVPLNPYPMDFDQYVRTNKGLAWANSDFTTSTHVAFGTNPDALTTVYYGIARENIPNAELGGTLAGNTTYYWQVTSYNQEDTATVGPLWQFTTGSAGPDIHLKYPEINMFVSIPSGGEIEVGNNLSIYNLGNSDLIISSIDAPDFPFGISSYTFPITIAPEGTFNLSYYHDFVPAGEYLDTLFINNNDPAHSRQPVPMHLTVEAYATITANPNPLYASLNPGESVTLPLTLYNYGTEALHFSRNIATSSWINISPLSGDIPPQDSLQINVTLVSTSLTFGNNTGQLLFSTNAVHDTLYAVAVDVNIIQPPISVDFSATPVSGHSPLTVQFTDQTVYGAEMTDITTTGWRWDFDDDGVIDSYEQNPSFRYDAPGNYTVTLTAITSNGLYRSITKADFIHVTNGAPVVVAPFPHVEFAEDGVSSWLHMNTYFADPDTDYLTYSGDNSEHLTITYYTGMIRISAEADWYGSEAITIHATDPYDQSCSQIMQVTVLPVNDSPAISLPNILYCIRNAHFTKDFSPYASDPDNPDEELSMTLTNVSPTQMVSVNYQPGVPGALIAVFYPAAGWIGSEDFTIGINDNMGRLIATTTFTLNVLEHFTADFSASVDNSFTGLTGENIVFEDHTLGNPTNWSWNFGDNTPLATDANPTHAYAAAGSYTVTMTISNTEAQESHTMSLLLHMVGTAITGEIIDDQTWNNTTDAIYNLVGPIEIDSAATVTIQDGVTINIIDSTNVVVNGGLNATDATFQFNGSGGFVFNPTELGSNLNGCTFLDGQNPLQVLSGDIILEDIYIAPSDSSNTIDGVGLHLFGASDSDLDTIHILNYDIGIMIEGDGSRLPSTPTLTNVRVRNSESSTRSRIATTGVMVTGEANAQLTDVIIENYDTGLSITSGASRTVTTPILTNVRIRNSASSTRATATGISIDGTVNATITDCIIEDCSLGLEFKNGEIYGRTTPTLTNVRVRNSESSTRNTDVGIHFDNMAAVNMVDCDVFNYTTGIKVTTPGNRTTSTPTLTNVRIRNSASSTRNETMGIMLTGDINPQLRDLLITDYQVGLRFDAAGRETRLGTPTLTNVRIRNSESSTRTFTTGIQMIDVPRFIAASDTIEGYHLGLEITATGNRTTCTPTLTNVRVRNSSSSTRQDNIGIMLGANVSGLLKDCLVEEADIGILIADGNRTVVKQNMVKNCLTGIRASGQNNPLPLKNNLFILQPAWQQTHPLAQFKALNLLFNGPWLVRGNTMSGYPVAVHAQSAQMTFQSNIVWADTPLQTPFIMEESPQPVISYNCIFYPGGFQPEQHNISADPQFVSAINDDFHLTYDSPCIDAGYPGVELDSDLTVAEIGAYSYLHKADYQASARFVTVGTTVQFTDTSIGHDYPFTTYAWDLNNDNVVESTASSWSHQFDTPGIYTIKYTVATGSLIDEKVLVGAIIVQDDVLPLPANFRLGIDGQNIVLNWNPVQGGLGGQSGNVPFYVLYESDKPDGEYVYTAMTDNGRTTYTRINGAGFKSRFFIVIGFAGSREELDRYIESHRTLRREQTPVNRSK